jgi:hypothetical protein
MEPYNPIYDDCPSCGPDGGGCEECEDRPFVMSDSGKALIDCGADWVGDHVAMERAELAEGASFAQLWNIPHWLPAVFARHYTPEFLDRFVLAVEAVREKLKTPHPYLACTAEELAAHAILDQAESWGEDWDVDDLAEVGIVDEARGRADVEWLKDMAFEDHDVLMLFDARMDGVEVSDIAERMGFANLAAPDWFKPFRSDDGGELHELSSAPARD